ncbi:MAG TPA: hypothetical protein VGR96_06820 [Acidobacteriaceae bacterium]|nr:hypothetical protein [Acidobacteriaceae bacterium]
MNSYNVLVHSDTGRQEREKKPWTKPVLEVVALESAEASAGGNHPDGNGHFSRQRS